MKWIVIAGFGLIALYSLYKIFWVRLNISLIAETVKQYIIGQTKKILNEYHIKRKTLIFDQLKKGFEEMLDKDTPPDDAFSDKEFKDEIEIEVNNCKSRLEKLSYTNTYNSIVPIATPKIYWYAIVHGVNDFRKFIDQEYFLYIKNQAEETKDLEVTDEHLKSIMNECIKE